MASQKQKTAVKKTLENLGSKNPKPTGQILKESGYKPSVAKTPSIVTESKGFKELLEEHLPENLVTQRHNELLSSARMSEHLFNPTYTEEEVEETIENDDGEEEVVKKTKKITTHVEDKVIKDIIESLPGCKVLYIQTDRFGKKAFFSQPDHKNRKDAIEMAYKLRGNFVPEKVPPGVNVNLIVNPKVTQVVKQFEDNLKEAYLVEEEPNTNESD